MIENLVSLQLFDGIVMMHVHVYACTQINMSSIVYSISYSIHDLLL